MLTFSRFLISPIVVQASRSLHKKCAQAVPAGGPIAANSNNHPHAHAAGGRTRQVLDETSRIRIAAARDRRPNLACSVRCAWTHSAHIVGRARHA